MKSALLVLGLLLVPSQDDAHLRELIERLVDDDIGVREKSAVELCDLGRAAAPALEKARRDGDVELRSRAASILKSIAENEVVSRHWRRGKRITLEADGVPLVDVLDDLAKQAGDRFKFDAAQLQDPVTLRVRDATFFDALEALCRAAPELTWDGDPEGLAFTKKRRPPYPAKRQAEFSVWLDGITFTRDYDFTGNPRSTFLLNIASSWEAGIAPVAVEQRVSEIQDEDGANLVIPDRWSYGTRMDAPKGRVRREGVYLPVPQGGKTARMFSRVKGTVSFYFPKSYEDVTVDVRSAPAPVTVDRMTITIRNVRALKDSCAAEIILAVDSGSSEGMIDRLPFSDIAVVDDKGGQHVPKSSSRSHSYNGSNAYTIHENLNVPIPEGRTPVAVKLRLLKEALEKRVAFEFTDIRLE